MKSLMRKYFTLAVAALVLASIVICTILIWYSIEQLTLAQEASIRQSVELAADACQRDLESLRGIALNIRVNFNYSPGWILGNGYREMKMLDDFKRLTVNVDGTQAYFLVYRDRPGWAFTSAGNAAALEVYLKWMGQKDIDELSKRLFERESMFIFEPEESTDLLLIGFTMRFINERGDEPSASLVFVVNRNYFDEIYQSYMGRFQTAYRIEYGQNTLSTRAMTGKRVMEVCSTDGSVRILTQYDEDLQRSLISYFANINAVYPLLILLSILLLGSALSYVSIRPLRKMISRFSGSATAGACKNELTRLEEILVQETTRSDFSRFQLKQQMP